METITLPHLSQHPLQVCLFTDVKNAPFLRRQLLEGNRDFEYAFLDASMILSRKQIFAACFRAINDSINARSKSHNVHSEIVFSLSPNNNIAESFRRFGISDDSKHILAIKISKDASQVREHLRQSVEGDAVPFTDSTISEMRDVARVRKAYRLEVPKKGQDLVLGREAEAFVLGSIALKGS